MSDDLWLPPRAIDAVARVEVGQLWRWTDKRRPDRVVRVIAVDWSTRTATVTNLNGARWTRTMMLKWFRIIPRRDGFFVPLRPLHEQRRLLRTIGRVPLPGDPDAVAEAGAGDAAPDAGRGAG